MGVAWQKHLGGLFFPGNFLGYSGGESGDASRLAISGRHGDGGDGKAGKETGIFSGVWTSGSPQPALAPGSRQPGEIFISVRPSVEGGRAPVAAGVNGLCSALLLCAGSLCRVFPELDYHLLYFPAGPYGASRLFRLLPSSVAVVWACLVSFRISGPGTSGEDSDASYSAGPDLSGIWGWGGGFCESGAYSAYGNTLENATAGQCLAAKNPVMWENVFDFIDICRYNVIYRPEIPLFLGRRDNWWEMCESSMRDGLCWMIYRVSWST